MIYVGRDRSTPNGGAPSGYLCDEESALFLELRAAASTNAIPTIRAVAADLAARADFDLDSIDDLRMAVDELCAMLVRVAAADGMLSCRFTVRPERIEVAAEVDVDGAAEPLPTRTFGWRVLECLADEVTAGTLPAQHGQYGKVCITLVKFAATAQQP